MKMLLHRLVKVHSLHAYVEKQCFGVLDQKKSNLWNVECITGSMFPWSNGIYRSMLVHCLCFILSPRNGVYIAIQSDWKLAIFFAKQVRTYDYRP